ncbi:hypothetical protein [Sporomusa ovata]|nr:hypothetical protein [Sporomusa ovata]
MADARFGEAARRDMENFFDRAIGSDSPVVAPVGGDILMEMLDALADVHGIAYDWIPVLDVEALVAELGSQPIRTYVRAALEALDIRYIYNENVKMTVTELTEQALEEEDGFLSEADCE